MIRNRTAEAPSTPREEIRSWRPRRLGGWILGLVLLTACGGGTRARRPDGLDTSHYPPEIQQAYDVFAFRCSKCHSLARPLNAQVTDLSHWDDYVARMRRQPGSGINRSNARVILKFLYYYTQHRGEGAPSP